LKDGATGVETAVTEADRIVHVQFDETVEVRRRPEVEHERAVAMYDLVEDNHFAPVGAPPGPYRLHLANEDNRLLFDVRDGADAPLVVVPLPLRPFHSIVKDYFLVCESYYAAIRKATPSQIEAIDMGRRGLHNEGSAMLRDRLTGKIAIDFDTARRLFTLLCILHIRG
jgi:uncharacterized protein (UPF0262 family)